MEVIWENDFVEVVQKEGFKSLIAGRNYQKGELVCLVEGEEISEPNRYSVQIEKKLHINVKEPIMYINHNCDGNIQLEGRSFIANRVIKTGEEITFDYNETENILAEPFTCFRCGQNVKGREFSDQYPCLKIIR